MEIKIQIINVHFVKILFKFSFKYGLQTEVITYTTNKITKINNVLRTFNVS